MSISTTIPDEEHFFIFSKNRDEWFVGNPNGVQKSISKQKTFLNNFFIDSESIVSSRQSTDTKRNILTDKKNYFEKYSYSIFYEIANTICKDDSFWNNIFMKMSKNIFHDNIKFLVSDNLKNKRNEDFIGELSLKKSATFGVQSSSSVKKNKNLILHKKDTHEEIFTKIKEFYKKHLHIVSDKENLENINISKTLYEENIKDNIKRDSIQKNTNKFNVSLLKSNYELKTFVKSVCEEKKYIKKKPFEEILFMFLRSIFYLNDIFEIETQSNVCIKKIKNIIWNKDTKSFIILFSSNLKLSDTNSLVSFESEQKAFETIVENNFIVPPLNVKENKLIKDVISASKIKFFIGVYEDFIFQRKSSFSINRKFVEKSIFDSKKIFKTKLLYPSIFFAISQINPNAFYKLMDSNYTEMLSDYTDIDAIQLKHTYEKCGVKLLKKYENYEMKKINQNFFDEFKNQKDIQNIFKILYKNFLEKLICTHYSLKKNF